MHCTHYSITCHGCGLRTADDGLITLCPRCGEQSLLDTDYQADHLPLAHDSSGVFRYRAWLPVHREVPGSARPAVYRCHGLGSALGLEQLWIAFSGHWPERNCHMASGTFKELEAFTVLGRTPSDAGVMVVASAGNTAASFAAASHRVDFPCVLIVPERALPALAGPHPVGERVAVVALQDGTYNDVLTFGKALTATSSAFFAEGGVRNVARRDGLAVVMLAAYEEMGFLPDYYVQAVGSGAGALAADRAARRIAAMIDGRPRAPRPLLCQNAEFAPLRTAWRKAGRPSADSTEHRAYAPELLNATPPFAVAGGIRDLLTRGSGDVLVATREEAVAAAALFEAVEGIDIEPAAAVAVACLKRATESGSLAPDARILLNVTGGGRRRQRTDRHTLPPAAWVVPTNSDPEILAGKLLGELT
ncbi:cysteate synthase [Kitasatospora purpeofusca]|uniref:cysteate synthase n=1 Tax=Kitasatospora purpeofusca TaxID=67352 RepID=UPI0036E36449